MSVHPVPDVRVTVRHSLIRLGGYAGPRQLAKVRAVLSYLELGHWLKERPSELNPEVVEDKWDLFAMALRRLTGNEPLYLEFGVFEGRSMRWWSQHLTTTGAKFVGFDSFEGLPENWRPGFDSGEFATGAPPAIADDRVSFEVGWFEDSLPRFTLPSHDQLFINIDSDLYSSATTVLNWAEPRLTVGTLIYFDEFPDRDHEMRAFQEFASRSSHAIRPLAMTRGGTHWLFEVVS